MCYKFFWFILLIFGAQSNFVYSSTNFSDLKSYQNNFLNGTATFSGEVVNPTCNLIMDNEWQSVSIGDTPVRELISGNYQPEKKFQINLVNCDLIGHGENGFTGSRVRFIFDGLRGKDPYSFYLSGQAKGISLQLIDENGFKAELGKVMLPLQLNGNKNKLNFKLRIVKDGESISAGEYYASIRFKVIYE